MLVISLVMRRNQQEAIRVERENNARLETVNTDMKKTKRIVRDRWKMKGKRVIAGILLAGILAVTLAGWLRFKDFVDSCCRRTALCH